MIHARLQALADAGPERIELGYFKPYDVDVNNKTKFKAGEIDFLLRVGRRLIPIEVKATRNLRDIDALILDRFVAENKLPFGIVLYGGAAHADKEKKRIYWPCWAV